MVNFSEDIGEEVISQLREFIDLLETKIKLSRKENISILGEDGNK